MIDDNLIKAVRERRVLLFIGSGVSATLGLPNWSQLISQLAEDVGYAPEVFELLGDNLELAEYYQLKKSLGPLRSWMDREWHKSNIDIGKSKTHELIMKLDCPIIYTTNYDRWLERAYKHFGRPYTRIANVADMVHIRDGNTQIVKFHGDFDESDDSIVLTESSYFERLAFDGPLDIKLRADVLGRSILFLGYSLSDINIRLLLYKLKQLWDSFQRPDQRPRSYIFLRHPNEVQQTILEHRGIHTVTSNQDDPTKGLEAFLEELVTATR